MRLSDEQAQLFLEPNYAVATTLNADGSPQSSVVWVDWDGEHVLFNTAEGRVKPRNLRRDPRVNVLVIHREDPYRWIAVAGRAELTEEGAEEHISKLGRRYRGWDQYPLKPGEQRLIVRVHAERVNAYGFR
jgi:PPOX class probable F420-dependent enzyme